MTDCNAYSKLLAHAKENIPTCFGISVATWGIRIFEDWDGRAINPNTKGHAYMKSQPRGKGNRVLDKKRYEEFMSDPDVQKGIADFEKARREGTLKTITYEELVEHERRASIKEG